MLFYLDLLSGSVIAETTVYAAFIYCRLFGTCSSRMIRFKQEIASLKQRHLHQSRRWVSNPSFVSRWIH